MKSIPSLVLSLAAASVTLAAVLASCSTDDGANSDGGADSGSGQPDGGGIVPTDGGGGGDGAPTVVATCAEYCDLVSTACPWEAGAPVGQYETRDQCLNACGAFPVGQVADRTDINSRACRYYHATVAAQPGAARLHCPHSGISGSGQCPSSRCAAFCSVAATYCGLALDGGGAPFASEAECLSLCADEGSASDGGFAFDRDAGEYDTDGFRNTLNCRLGTLRLAFSGGAQKSVHCPRLGPAATTDVDAGITPSCKNP
jgi:hypothetical protein